MCNYSDTQTHTHIHDIVSLTTTLVLMEPSVSLKDSNTVLNFRHYSKFEVNVQTMILIVTSHIHVISCAVVLPFFVKTHMYNKTCFHFQHIHIHDIVSMTTTLVLMEPSVSLKDSNTVLNFRHYSKFEVNVQTMILIVTSHIHVISCAVVLPFFVKTHMYNKTCFHFQHIHIHDIVSITTTLVLMEPSVSLKDSNTVLNFRH